MDGVRRGHPAEIVTAHTVMSRLAVVHPDGITQLAEEISKQRFPCRPSDVTRWQALIKEENTIRKGVADLYSHKPKKYNGVLAEIKKAIVLWELLLSMKRGSVNPDQRNSSEVRDSLLNIEKGDLSEYIIRAAGLSRTELSQLFSGLLNYSRACVFQPLYRGNGHSAMDVDTLENMLDYLTTRVAQSRPRRKKKKHERKDKKRQKSRAAKRARLNDTTPVKFTYNAFKKVGMYLYSAMSASHITMKVKTKALGRWVRGGAAAHPLLESYYYRPLWGPDHLPKVLYDYVAIASMTPADRKINHNSTLFVDKVRAEIRRTPNRRLERFLIAYAYAQGLDREAIIRLLLFTYGVKEDKEIYSLKTGQPIKRSRKVGDSMVVYTVSKVSYYLDHRSAGGLPDLIREAIVKLSIPFGKDSGRAIFISPSKSWTIDPVKAKEIRSNEEKINLKEKNTHG